MSDAHYIAAARDVFASIGAASVSECQLFALADLLEEGWRRGASRLGFTISGQLIGAGLNEQAMARKILETGR